MAEELNSTSANDIFNWRGLVGGALVVGGGFLLIDQLFHLGWLAPLSFLAGSLVLLAGGLRMHSKGLLVSGAILLGLGLGIALAYEVFGAWNPFQRIGLVLLFSGVGFGLVEILLRREHNLAVWWPAFPLVILGACGACFLASPAGVLDFILFLSVGLGLAFLAVGLSHHWIGFIIPACLLVSTGLGVYIPWGTRFGVNALSKTGGMLVMFAFGWGLITLFSRVPNKGFIWWPLIPGGLLAVVGWGLYVGGDPGNAFRFIGNTGTVAILLIGFYLMMMRKGIR